MTQTLCVVLYCLYMALTKDQGVVTSVASLVMALAQDHLDAYAVCYTKAVDRLNRVRCLTIENLSSTHNS